MREENRKINHGPGMRGQRDPRTKFNMATFKRLLSYRGCWL